MNEDKLKELVTRSQAGDFDALEALLCGAYTPISYQASRILQDRQAVRKVTYEILHTIKKELGQLEDPDAFVKWRNLLTARHCVDLFSQLPEPPRTSAPLDVPISNEILSEADTAHVMEQVIDRMPGDVRVMLTLYACNGLNILSLADVLECSQQEAQEKLDSALSALEKALTLLKNQGIQFPALPPLPKLAQIAMEQSRNEAEAEAMVGRLVVKPSVPAPKKVKRKKKWLIPLLLAIAALLLVVVIVLLVLVFG